MNSQRPRGCIVLSDSNEQWTTRIKSEPARGIWFPTELKAHIDHPYWRGNWVFAIMKLRGITLVIILCGHVLLSSSTKFKQSVSDDEADRDEDDDEDDSEEDYQKPEMDEDGRIYKNPRNSPSSLCPRDEEQADRLSQKCLRKCSTDEDCKSKKKKCRCDGACGMSCIKPDRECPDIEDISHAVMNVTGRFFGDTVHYVCDPGYFAVGLSVRSCRADGQWTGSTPACKKDPNSFCVEPPKVKNARNNALPDQTTFDIDSTVKYFCHYGYATDDGFHTAKCLTKNRAPASWFGPDISCKPKDCGPPSNIPNGWHAGSLHWYTILGACKAASCYSNALHCFLVWRTSDHFARSYSQYFLPFPRWMLHLQLSGILSLRSRLRAGRSKRESLRCWWVMDAKGTATMCSGKPFITKSLRICWLNEVSHCRHIYRWARCNVHLRRIHVMERQYIPLALSTRSPHTNVDMVTQSWAIRPEDAWLIRNGPASHHSARKSTADIRELCTMDGSRTSNQVLLVIRRFVISTYRRVDAKYFLDVLFQVQH